MEREWRRGRHFLTALWILLSAVLGLAAGERGHSIPHGFVRRELRGQAGKTGPYQAALRAAERAAEAAPAGSDEVGAAALAKHMATEASAKPLQAAAPPSPKPIAVYTPATAGVLDGAAFSTFLANQYAAKSTTGVKLAPGSYNVTPNSNDGHIYMSCAAARTAAFEIDLSLTTLTFTVGTIGYIVLDTCTAVYLHGPTTLTYSQAQFPLAQGTIVTVTDYLHYTIQIWDYFLPAWNNIISSNSEAGTGVCYSGTTREVYPPNRGGADFIVDYTQVQQVNANTFNVVLVRNPYATIVAGDFVALTQISDATGIALYGSKKCTIASINMVTAAGFAYYDGIPPGQNTYINNRLAPSPVPGTDGQLQIMTSIHDGFHTTSASVGPIMTNCTYIGAGDDSIAIHGRMYTVAAFNATQLSIVAGSQIISAAELNAGDRITLYDQSARQLGTTYVVSVASVSAPPGITSSTPDPVFSTTFAGYSYLKLVVTVWPPGFADLSVGSFITVPSRDGDYYRLTSNYIYNGRGCGVISKASNGVISGNSINKMLYPAIELSPSFQAKEGSFVSNTTVSNNVINTLSQGILLGWGNYALDLPYVYGNNINNSFTNNQITGSQISPLTLTSALTASVVNLAMIDVMCGMFGDNTRQFGWETQNTPFNLAYVYGITFSGNSLTTTPNCQRNLANYAAPWAFINVTHVVGQPLPIYPNAPTLQTPTPGGPPAPPPPPGGMLPPFLPGMPSMTMNKTAWHDAIANAATQAHLDLVQDNPLYPSTVG